MFDTDHNGLIDAIEIFSGIIVFSDAAAEEKIRFLFDLYDFNEMQSLSLMELEFMLSSVLDATKKIFALTVDFSDAEIVQLVRKNFSEGERIPCADLLVWSAKNEEIRSYFAKFKLIGPLFLT